MGANMQNNVTIPIEELDDCVHVSLEFSKFSNKVTPFPMTVDDRTEVFHIAMKMADADWPFALAYYDKNTNNTYSANEQCPVCGGLIYMNPNLSPNEIISVSNQLGLAIGKMKYIREQDCKVISNIRFGGNGDNEKKLIDEVMKESENKPSETKALISPKESSFGYNSFIKCKTQGATIEAETPLVELSDVVKATLEPLPGAQEAAAEPTKSPASWEEIEEAKACAKLIRGPQSYNDHEDDYPGIYQERFMGY